MIKPHFKRMHISWHDQYAGVSNGWRWWCSYDGAIGHGFTPVEAFLAMAKDRDHRRELEEWSKADQKRKAQEAGELWVEMKLAQPTPTDPKPAGRTAWWRPGGWLS